MRKISIRDSYAYGRHLTANEPEEHAEISIEMMVKVMEQIKGELEDRDLGPDYRKKLELRIEETKAYLP